MTTQSMEIPLLLDAYRSGQLTPVQVVSTVFERIEACTDQAIWISLAEKEQALARARQLEADDISCCDLPLFGIPFAIKDNIDATGFATTAGCPDFAYQPDEDATVVRQLLAAGAILIGKTNLDQFATGLVGTRSPFGVPRSVFNSEYISGGSSSGSAVAVAAGLVSFALGTDTAGSGRVPAAFNNLVGVKPTKGLVSNRGVVPACRSLDCVTVFAASCGEADLVRRVMQCTDSEDPYSRKEKINLLPYEGFRFGILAESQQEFFDDHEAKSLYEKSIANLAELGGTAVEFDYRPFQKSAELLYSGPWVAERYAAVGAFCADHASSVDPTVRIIIEGSDGLTAVDAFRGQYALQEYARHCDDEWKKVDLLLLPTTPTTYKVAEVEQDPLRLNSRLGTYTNFVNLLDCSAVAVPAGFRASSGLPFGVSLIAPAYCDEALAQLADKFHRATGTNLKIGGTDLPLSDKSMLLPTESTESVTLAVVGAHLTGQPLNFQLTDRGAKIIATTKTAGNYRLYALQGTMPLKPGLVHDPGYKGAGVEVEVWELSREAFGAFTQEVPSPLGIGSLTLMDGSMVKGFICEPWAIETAKEITAFCSWRNYLASKKRFCSIL